VTQARTSRATGELFVHGHARADTGSVGLFDDLIGLRGVVGQRFIIYPPFIDSRVCAVGNLDHPRADEL